MENTVFLDRERVVRLTDEGIARVAEYFGVRNFDEVNAKLGEMGNNLEREAVRWWLFLAGTDPWLTLPKMKRIIEDFINAGNWKRQTRKMEKMRPAFVRALEEYKTKD
jgi:hypothetical protein